MALYSYEQKAKDETVQIPNELFWVITSLVGGVIGLLAYLWKSKDSAIDKIDLKLDKIMSSQTEINTKVTVMEHEIANLNHILRAVEIRLSKHDNEIDLLRSEMTSVKEWRRNQEKK